MIVWLVCRLHSWLLGIMSHLLYAFAQLAEAKEILEHWAHYLASNASAQL